MVSDLQLCSNSNFDIIFQFSAETPQTSSNTDAPETVVANLVYDESQDQLHSPLLASGESDEKFQHPNPVFQAFDDAKSSDDLFRIAEIWVSPNAYYPGDED